MEKEEDMTVYTKIKKTKGNMIKDEIYVHKHIKSIIDEDKIYCLVVGENYKIILAKELHEIISIS